MFRADQYELLDFGQGRKLERFGELVVDRPAPAATDMASRQLRSVDGGRRTVHSARCGAVVSWTLREPVPTPWYVHHGACTLQLKPSDSGAIGIFPEQAENWDWIEQQVRGAGGAVKVLNLFALHRWQHAGGGGRGRQRRARRCLAARGELGSPQCRTLAPAGRTHSLDCGGCPKVRRP